MMGYYGPWSGFHLMWIFPFLFLIVMVLCLSVFLRGGRYGCGRRDYDETPRETPRQILDRRYASGEISKEQYEAMKKDLNL
jgi:putative membrane protein